MVSLICSWPNQGNFVFKTFINLQYYGVLEHPKKLFFLIYNKWQFRFLVISICMNHKQFYLLTENKMKPVLAYLNSFKLIFHIRLWIQFLKNKTFCFFINSNKTRKMVEKNFEIKAWDLKTTIKFLFKIKKIECSLKMIKKIKKMIYQKYLNLNAVFENIRILMLWQYQPVLTES